MKVDMGMCESERRQTNFLALYNSLGSTVATQEFRKNIGKLMWVVFNNFLQNFPLWKRITYRVSTTNALTPDITSKKCKGGYGGILLGKKKQRRYVRQLQLYQDGWLPLVVWLKLIGM